MKPVYQTNFTIPGGNCFQASVASVLDLPLEAVPDFCNLYDDDNWWSEFVTFCLGRGLYPLSIDSSISMPKNPVIFHLALGRTKQEHYHAVVYANGELVHDPNGGSGLAVVECYIVFASTMVQQCSPLTTSTD